MSTYSLTINFEAMDVRIFGNCNSRLIIAKSSPGGFMPSVAWLPIRPMETNVITWEDTYGIYASSTEYVTNAVIKKKSRIDSVEMGSWYELEHSGTFGSPEENKDKGAYGIDNQYKGPNGYMVMGLTQDAVVDDEVVKGAIVSAAKVPYKSSIQMATIATIYIWMASGITNGSVISDISSTATKVELTSRHSCAVADYKCDKGRFVLQSGTDGDGAIAISYLDAV